MTLNKLFGKLGIKIGIQGKLYFLFILLSTLPISFISIYVIQKQISTQKEEAMMSVKNEVNDIKVRTSLLLSRVHEELSLLSKTSEARNFIRNYYEINLPIKKEDNDFEKEFSYLLDGNDLYYKVELLDRIGRKVFSVSFEDGKPIVVNKKFLPKRPLHFYKYLVQGMPPDEIILSLSEIKTPSSGKLIPLIDCVIPIQNDYGDLNTILIASINAEDFFKFFKLSKHNEKVKVVMVNREGIYLYHSMKKNDWNSLLAKQQEENLLHDYSKKVSDSILTGVTGTIADDPERIIEYASIFSHGPEGDYKYIVFTEIPKDVAFESVYQLRDFLIMLCVIVALLSIITGYYTSRLFLRPINRLIQGTRIIRDGNLDYKLDIETEDEIQELVISFNKMVGYWKENKELMERQRLIEDVKERKKYLENIMDSSLDLLITLTSEGNLSFANKRLEDLLGYSVEEVKGKSYLDFFPESQHEFLIGKWDELKNSNGIIYDSQIIKTDGSIVECLVSLSPLNGLNEYLAIIKDITERKQAEAAIILAKEKAEEANRLKTNIISNMGHELRTPMIGILGFSKMLDGLDDMEDVKEVGDMIVQSSTRLMQTLNLIIDISKIESGFYTPELTLIDFIEIASATVSMYQKTALEKNLELIFEHDVEHLMFYSDLSGIQNILNNIIDNAIKFTFSGSVKLSISKKTVAQQSYVVVKFFDTGIGIAPENLKTIFDAFRQGSEGLSREHEGTGLGLTLSKKYIDILGGTINVQSKINEGSIFTVKLPIKELNMEEVIDSKS